MADIGSLVVKISADASELAKELNKISEGGSKTAEHVANAGKIMAGALIATTAAAVASTLAIAKQVEGTDLLSQKTGIAVQTLQSWSVVMAENNFQAESLTTGMRTLSKQILEVHNPASTAANAFETLGIGIEKLGSTEDTIRAVADAFKNMPDGAEKSALAVQLFGKAGLEMIPILNKGSAALDASKAAAQKYGLVLSTDAVNALKAVDDSSDNLGLSLQGLQTQLAAAFAPSLKKVIDEITQSIVSLKIGIFGVKEAMGDTSAQAFIGRAIVEDAQEQIKLQEAYEIDRGEREEAVGTELRNRFIRTQKFIEAEKKAQEQLGHDVLQIAERERKERNDAFGEQMLHMERLQSLSEGLGEGGHGATGGAFEASVKHQHEIVRNLEAIGISTGDYVDQIDRGNEQEALGLAIMKQAQQAYAQRHDDQELEVELAESVAQEQKALFAQEQGLFGASESARRTQMRLIDERYTLEKALIEESGMLEEKKILKIQALDQRTNAQRMAVAEQFPSFMEKQLNSVIASNAFAIGSIVNTWTSGIATMIVKGGDLKAAWEATQIALIQGALNTGVQMAAEAAKTVVVNGAAATACAAIWEGFAAAVAGAFATVSAAFMAMTATMAEIMIAVGEAIMGVLTAIAEALVDTVFGSPMGVAILAGVVAIGIALGALAAVGVFAEGGIVTGPMLGLVGEAGPEAIIPLDRMSSLGGANDRPIQTTINIDGKRAMRALSRHTASAWRAEGAGA